jgi:hypothetical protein
MQNLTGSLRSEEKTILAEQFFVVSLKAGYLGIKSSAYYEAIYFPPRISSRLNFLG